MTNPLIYTDTIGCVLNITVPCDLTVDVTKLELAVKKPSGTTAVWTPSAVEFANGITTITYETKSGDLNEPGGYRVQPVVTLDDGDFWPLGVAVWTIIDRYEVA